MIKKFLIIAVSLLTFMSFHANGKKNEPDYKQQIKVLNDSIAKLNNVIITLRSLPAPQEGQTQEKTAGNLESAGVNINMLLDSITCLNALNSKLSEELDHMDMVKVRYANGRLQLPYDKAKVKEAIEMFNTISNPSLKAEYGPILILLNDYERQMAEVKELIEAITYTPQKFPGDEVSAYQAWKKNAKDKINNNKFYQENKNKTDDDFHIYFLKDVIEETKGKIDAATRFALIPNFKDIKAKLNMK